MIRLLRLIVLMVLFAFTLGQIEAQVTTGTPPFGSFGGGPDVINLANLNSHIVVPVLHKPGRGTNFTYDLSYDSSVWYPASVNGVQTWQPVINLGWRGVTEVATGYVSYNLWRGTCVGEDERLHTYTVRDTWVYHDPFGASHNFNQVVLVDDPGLCGIITEVDSDTARDGSGYSITNATLSGALVYSSAGKAIVAPINQNFGTATATDRNGNQITVNSSAQFFDTLSSTVPVLTVSGTGIPTNPKTFTYTAPSGAPATYTMNFTNYTVATNFGNSSIHEYRSSPTVPVPLVTSIQLPDGSQYTITYESTPAIPTLTACTPITGTTCVTARIASITYPTGGTISYLYYNASNNFTACTTGNNGAFSDGSASCLLRTTPDGIWTYTRAQGTGSASTTTIAAPQLPYDSAANQTVIQFQKIYETNRVTNQGASTALQTTNTCYNGAASPCIGTAITLPIMSRIVSTILAGSSNLTDQHSMTYDSYGNILTQTDYDYGNGAKGNLLGKTTITYASLGNIKAFSQTITKTDANSATVSQTQYNYDETPVQPTSGTPQHTSVTGSRGNLTSVYSYTSGSNHLTRTLAYFDTGNVQTATDVNNAQTTYTYGACGNSFPTIISEPLSMSRTLTWDINCTGGVTTSVKDENSNTTTITYSDPYFWRPASVSYPDSGQVSLTYNSPTTFTITQKMSSSQNIVSTILSDGLGRTKKTELNSDPSGVDYVDTTYDVLGRVYMVSNPYRTISDPTYGITTFQYDALSRPNLIIPPDGAQTTNNISGSYTNNCVTAADQASKKVTTCSNSLGYLTQVFEDPSGLNYETDYTVNPLGNILTVTQKGGSTSNYRVRNYTYDFISRLTQSVDPEAGTVNYSYDGNGNLLSETSPAPNQVGSQTVTVSYCYDALHRTTAKAYTYSPTTPPTCSGTPPTFPSPVTTYLYDASSVNGTTLLNPIGRLSQSKASASLQSLFSYDTMGRVKAHYQTTPQYPSSPFQVNTVYDAAGDPTSTQYESGSGTTNITYTYTNNNVGLPTTLTSSLVDSSHPGTLASNISYGPQGAPVQGRYGNSLTEAAAFNTRFQPCRVNLNSSASPLANCSSSAPTGTVLDLALGYNSGTSNNGNVATFAATGQQTFTRSYGYDGVNRLSTYSDSASAQACKGLSWGYDGWGNLLNQQTTSGTCLHFSSGVGTNNQLSSPYAYDAAGNMTNDTTNTYYYDAEHRLIQVNGTLGTCGTATACYTYDAEGRRVEKTTSAQTLDYVYDNQNRVIAEFQPSQWATGYAYLGGQLLAEYTQGTTYFVTKDHLGSARLVSAVNGSVADSMDYYPYGIQMAGGTATTHKFTGDERDSETNLDHTPFRQYSSSVERWMTPDPAGFAAVDPTNPQSWNQYAYVQNNPLAATDPTGLVECIAPIDMSCDEPCDFFEFGCGSPLPIGGGGGGGGGGRAPSGPPETPIPEAPTNVGEPQDPGFGNGPIWTEKIPISPGPLSPFLIIQNITTGDASDAILNLNIPFLWLQFPGMALPPNWQPKGMRPPYFPPTDGPPLDKGPGWPSSKPPTDWEPGPGTKFGWQRFMFFAGELLKDLRGGGSFILLINPCRSGAPGPVIQPDGTVSIGCPVVY
jgi:RHS repeat-associated protein